LQRIIIKKRRAEGRAKEVFTTNDNDTASNIGRSENRSQHTHINPIASPARRMRAGKQKSIQAIGGSHFVGADMTVPIGWALATCGAFGSLPTWDQSDVDLKALTR
jgi:hypothetical protein